MKHTLLTIFTAVALAALAMPAQAVPIQTALGIVIDGSGSISTTNFTTQKTEYVSALGSLVPTDGSVVLYANQFSTGVVTESIARRINDAADLTAFINGISSMNQLGNNTNIGAGISDAVSALDTFLSGPGLDFASNFRKLIDVSTDGQANEGTDPATVAASAVAGSYDQINCLGIGAGADCSWIPSGSFSIAANNFTEFGNALHDKLTREIIGVPAPATIALFALGLILVGAGVMRRRA